MNVTWNTSNRKLNLFQTGSKNVFLNSQTCKPDPLTDPLTFCFYQQKIEWVRLKYEHPEAFEEAKTNEKNAVEHGSPFTWCQGESLEELEQPERVEKIKQDHELRIARMKSKSVANPLRPDSEPLDIDALYGKAKGCLACHK